MASKTAKKKVVKNSDIEKANNSKEIKAQIEIENNQISQEEIIDKNIQEKTGWWS